MDSIAASSDRVTVHQAIKHLVVGGNALLFMGKDGIKHYPLNRYVVERDGNGNVIEIVTKELINKKLLPVDIVKDPLMVNDESTNQNGDVEVYTHCRLENNRWLWHQEVYDKRIPGTEGKAPKDTSPWLVLRFNSVDGENYGRGRVEEFIGDLKSLDALSQAITEGSAAAAKVVFLVSPSSTTKPARRWPRQATEQSFKEDLMMLLLFRLVRQLTLLQHSNRCRRLSVASLKHSLC